MTSAGNWRTRARALAARIRGTPDYARWSDASGYDDWGDRTKAIAALIPNGSAVLELGAGKRLLERHLGAGCTYTPCDLVSRGPDTIIFNLNGPLPNLGRRFDVAVLAGVLEYVRSVPTVLEWLAKHSDRVIASYCCAGTRPRSLRRLLEIYARAGAGWVSTYSQQQLIDAAARAGLSLEQAIEWYAPDREMIFEFRVSDSRER